MKQVFLNNIREITHQEYVKEVPFYSEHITAHEYGAPVGLVYKHGTGFFLFTPGVEDSDMYESFESLYKAHPELEFRVWEHGDSFLIRENIDTVIEDLPEDAVIRVFIDRVEAGIIDYDDEGYQLEGVTDPEIHYRSLDAICEALYERDQGTTFFLDD